MFSDQDAARLTDVAKKAATDLVSHASPFPDRQLRFDVHVALQYTLVSAGIPEERLTKDWSPEDDYIESGWLLQLYRFQDALRQTSAYCVFTVTPRHARGTLDLKRLPVEDYLFQRVKYAISKAAPATGDPQ